MGIGEYKQTLVNRGIHALVEHMIVPKGKLSSCFTLCNIQHITTAISPIQELTVGELTCFHSCDLLQGF